MRLIDLKKKLSKYQIIIFDLDDTIFSQQNYDTPALILVSKLIEKKIGISAKVIFQKLRKMTNNEKVWLRATGSTVVSQFIDSFLVLYIAFVLGPPQWPISLFLAVGVVNYAYKFLVAVFLTPLIYLGHNLIDNFLGEELAAAMKQNAILEG